MNTRTQYTQARQNLHSWFRFLSIGMLLAALGVLPAILVAFFSPGIMTLMLPPSLAGLAGGFALLRAKAGTEIDRFALLGSRHLQETETILDRELAEADPALGVSLRVGEQ